MGKQGPAAFGALGAESPGRHAVLQVLFPIPVMCENDIARNFREILPALKQWYAT